MTHRTSRLAHLSLILAAPALLGACQVLPPTALSQGPAGTVRAAAPSEALEVSEMLEELRPLVTLALPDATVPELEVWVQPQPALYRFEGETYAEADGFWSSEHGRIHLREGASSLRRTLAHELVHASLGSSWDALPGSLEEGLCDLISLQLAPADAAAMRAGRLSAAAFATGGLELDVEVLMPGSGAAVGLGVQSRLRLMGELSPDLDPNDVFRVRAGLSSTQLPPNDKKAFYGLSLLLLERIVDRIGIEGLHELCTLATSQGRAQVPSSWLLAAAELRPDGWHEAVHGALGSAELRELLLLYPAALLDSAQRLFGEEARVGIDLTGSSPLRARARVAWSEAEVEVGLRVESSLLAPQQIANSGEGTGALARRGSL